MQGDFTWDPFYYGEAVSRVLNQQGRVQLDRDFNENTEAVLRFLRGLGRDVIGPHGGVRDSFQILVPDLDKHEEYVVRWGAYYVDGIRCLNLPRVDYWETIENGLALQTGLPLTIRRDDVAAADKAHGGTGVVDQVLIYLDVYERHVSSEQDDSIREPALMGPDTSSRAVVTWKVRAIDARIFDGMVADFTNTIALVKFAQPGPTDVTWIGGGVDLHYLALNLLLRTGARMRAKATEPASTNACTIAPDARYRGVENRLFRVEIHDASVPDTLTPGKKATFKWSPDNASIVYPIREITGVTVHLDALGRDARTQLCVNDWVEVVDDQVLDSGTANPLLQVVDVSADDLTVKLSAPPTGNAGRDRTLHPILRRWASNVIPVETQASVSDPWTDLADGIQVQFSLADRPRAAYRTGDYWLVPARTANGNILWPEDNATPRAMPPNGVDHHYAPLARTTFNSPDQPEDLRFTFNPLAAKPV